jgi:hypothetical protein
MPRAKALTVLDRAAAELEELKSELAAEFGRLREGAQNRRQTEKIADQVRALDNAIGAIRVARSVLQDTLTIEPSEPGSLA